MANELDLISPSGATIYAVIRSGATVAQTTTETFVAWVDANIANYDVPLTDNSGDYYSEDFPDWIALGNYVVTYYLQAGATPATTDDVLASETINWGGGATSGGSPGGNTITIGQCVTLERIYGRNVGETDDDDGVYTLEQKHVALQDLLSDLNEKTKCITIVSSFDIEEDDEDIDLSGITGFTPERFKRAWIDGENQTLNCIGIDEINGLLAANTTSGKPCQFAFIGTTGLGRLDRVSDDDYTGKVEWNGTLTAWTAGDTGVANTTLNVPAYLARGAIKAGIIYYLQSNQPEHAELAAKSQQDFQLYCAQHMGANNVGERVHVRMTERRRRYSIDPGLTPLS